LEYKEKHGRKKITLPIIDNNKNCISWSRDGSYIIVGNCEVDCKFVVPLIKRNGWLDDDCFVGHKQTVTCVSWNPNIYKDATRSYLCCALGSEDGMISIWATKESQALCNQRSFVKW